MAIMAMVNVAIKKRTEKNRMRRVERSIPSRVKSLASTGCANYQGESTGVKNYCWMQEKSNHGVCVFFSDIETPRCQCFQEAVLPLDKELKGLFSPETLALQRRDDRKRMIRKRCERPGCQETFPARSNRQRFCPACQKWNENEKTRSRMADLRKKPNGMSLVTV